MSDYELRTVDATTVADLRRALLRDVLDDPGEGPDAFHIGVDRLDDLVAVGSVVTRTSSGGRPRWRLYGPAVEHGHRGLGVGALVLERCLEHVAEAGGGTVWCRVPAGTIGFFERFGFRRTGDPAVGGMGPEYLVEAKVGPLRRSWSI